MSQFDEDMAKIAKDTAEVGRVLLAAAIVFVVVALVTLGVMGGFWVAASVVIGTLMVFGSIWAVAEILRRMM